LDKYIGCYKILQWVVKTRN